MQVRDLMSKRVVKVSGITMLPDAARKMKEENIGAIPVEEADKLIGIVTDRDIAVRAVAKREIDVPVKDVMTPDPVCVAAAATVGEALRTMLDRHVRRLLVKDGDDLVGVISLEDLVEAGEDADLIGALRELHKETRHT